MTEQVSVRPSANALHALLVNELNLSEENSMTFIQETENLTQSIVSTAVAEAIASLSEKMDANSASLKSDIGTRFDSLETRLDSVETTVSEIKSDVDSIKTTLEEVRDKGDKTAKRLTKLKLKSLGVWEYRLSAYPAIVALIAVAGSMVSVAASLIIK